MATVASVYARAIFEGARERGELDAVACELREFWSLCGSNKALSSVLTGPAIDPADRKAVLVEVISGAELGKLSSRFLHILSARGRLAAMPGILSELSTLMDSAGGVVAGEVRSAVELSSDEIAILGASLSKKVGKKVRLRALVDPTLLGGVVAVVAGKTFDASLRTQMERFKNELI